MDALSPSIVLAAYAEPLLDGRRIVVFGDATSDLSAELLERGARSIHVYDAEPARAAVAAGRNRSKQISIVPLDDADIAVRDGAFDVAIVEDRSSGREPAILLKRVRRALSVRGAAIVASPTPDTKMSLLPRTSAAEWSAPLGYYELYDAVSAEFPEVRMLGQTPFVGYAVVDFAPEGEPDVSIDSGLVPGGAEEPEWFIALASRELVDCDAVGIVQLPALRVAGGGVSAALTDELRASRSAEARLLSRVAALEAEATQLRAELSRPMMDEAKHREGALEQELSRREAAIAALEQEPSRREAAIAALEQELSRREAPIAALEARAAPPDARARRGHEGISLPRANAGGEDDARALLAKLSSEKESLASELSALKGEKAELFARTSAISAEIGLLR